MTFLEHLPALSVYLVVAALVFSEVAFFFGFVPGELSVIVGGFVADKGHVNLAVLCVVVVAAVAAGGTVGYLIGGWLGPRMLQTRALRRHATTVNRALDGLRRRAATYVFFGRFAAIFRTVLPSLAGMSKVPFLRFSIANLASGAIWGVGWAVLGYAAGAAYGEVERDSAYGGGAVAGLFVVIAVVVWLRARRRRERTDASPQP